MATNENQQKKPAPKPTKVSPTRQNIGVVKLANGIYTKIGQVSKEIKAHTEDDYLCVARIKDRNVVGYVYQENHKVLPSSSDPLDWQNATFRQL